MKIQWKQAYKDGYWEAFIPAKDHRGMGNYLVTIEPRPHYCDRGNWLVKISSNLIEPLDHQEGFPRYYFSPLETVMAEIEAWADKRDTVQHYRKEQNDRRNTQSPSGDRNHPA